MTSHNVTNIEWSEAQDDRGCTTHELRMELDNGTGRPVTGAVWSSADPQAQTAIANTADNSFSNHHV